MATEILECGHTESPHSDITRGYGRDAEGNRHCYDCCAATERASMIETGKATLYLVKDGDKHAVTDWPGTLRFAVWQVGRGGHNIARVRYDFRFRGPDGYWWRGTQYGDNTQIAHCRRTKERISV